MKASTARGFVAINMENPAHEFEDFDRLGEELTPAVLRFVFAYLHDMDIAETLAQDCFLNAYKSRSTFRGECSVNTWLRIAVNLVRNYAQSSRFKILEKHARRRY